MIEQSLLSEAQEPETHPANSEVEGPSTGAVGGPSTGAVGGPSTEAVRAPSTEAVRAPSTEAVRAPSTEAPTGSAAPKSQGPVTIVSGIRAHKLLVALCGLALALVASVLAWVTSPGAQATGQLGLIQPAAGNVLLPVPAGDATMARYTAQRAKFVESDTVLEAVADSVPDATVEQLRDAISVVPSSSANSLLITAAAATPERAVLIAESVMDSYREATLADVEARTAASAEAWEAAGDEAEAKRVTIDGSAFGDGVEFEVMPSVEAAQSRDFFSKEALLGLVVGLGIGALIAWSIEDSRRRRDEFAAASDADPQEVT